MNQRTINDAVKNCVREALGQHKSLLALQGCLDKLNREGWTHIDIENVRNTCLGILSVIYDADDSVENDQAE